MPKVNDKVHSSKAGGRAAASGVDKKGKRKAPAEVEKGDMAATTQKLHVPALTDLFDTPQRKTVGGSQLSSVDNRAPTRNLELGHEMAKHAVGPMPITRFIDLIPLCPQHPDTTMPDSLFAFREVPKSGDIGFKDEHSLYDPVNEAFNARQKTSQGIIMARCPGVTFYNTSNQPGPGKYSTKVDGSGYAQQHLKFVTSERNSAIFSDSSLWEIFWEGKMIDFVGDNGELFEHITDKKKKEIAVRDFGQTSFYAIQMCANQYRKFAFSISVMPTIAQLLRWDRSGVIFSEAIRYRENPQLLCQFLWRFGNANSSQRGADMSVHQVNGGVQEALFRDTVRAHIKMQLGLTDEKEVDKALEKHYEPKRVCMVEVQGSEDQSSRYRTRSQTKAQPVIRKFLVSRPVVSPRSLASRSTRGFWAVDILTKNIVFLKDCWRADAEAVDMEGSILHRLRASGVEAGVPTAVCHGDVYVEGEVSSTLTSKYSENGWNKVSKLYLRSRIHYRIVTAEVGYSLQETFAGTRELVKGCQEVFYVLFNASTKANLIHRDISSMNIILVADETHGFGSRVAYVIDWEFAVSSKREEIHRDWWRTGTVAFMCMNALPTRQSHAPPTLYRHFFGHDVESLIYVALYCGLYRLPWNTYSETEHESYLSNLFSFPFGRGAKKVLVTEFESSDWMSVFPESEFRKWLIAALRLIPMWHPTPVSLPSPETILTQFSATVEVDSATLDELDAVPRKMPILGRPIEATNSATYSLPSFANSPNRSHNRSTINLSPLSEGAPKRGRFLRGQGQVVGSASATVGGNTGRREQLQVPGSSSSHAVGVRTRSRKRPGNESDEKEGQKEIKHRKKRRK
ncbi:hypothetical protein IW262DRAFT_365766 [Armillaria fumosa]|nr:hypothetical protein IW262DRAFT_365766 [Armillaria fumosa]